VPFAADVVHVNVVIDGERADAVDRVASGRQVELTVSNRSSAGCSKFCP
jgi:hypothetical protein